jgi:hypothetical protein
MRLAIAFLIIAGAAGAELVDRIAVVAGKNILKASDIDREIRITAFLNGEQPVFNADTRRKAADRLIDQTIIRAAVQRGGYPAPAPSDVDALIAKIRQERFGGSEARMRQELARYNLTEDQLRSHVIWQLTVLRFIDERFRPGAMVPDEQVRAYYDQHAAQFRNSGFDAVKDKIRDSLEAERLDKNFEQWLAYSRKRIAIEYKPEPFQ